MTSATRSQIDNQIDVSAREIASAALAGELDNHAARSRLAELLLQSNVCGQVAYGRQLSITRQHRVDLAQNMLSVLAGKILDPSSSFDLERIATGSLCGWARVLGQKFSKWDRDSVRPEGIDALTVRVSPTAPESTTGGRASQAHFPGDRATVSYHAAQAFGGLSAEEAALTDRDEADLAEALERVANLVGFAREPVRDRAAAAAMREVFRLPALCVPDRPGDRAAILELVLADVTLARRALVQMASMVCTEPPSLPPRGEAPVGELLLSLWDDFDPDHLESLMVRPARAAHTIVVDALTPMAKPSRGCLRDLTRAVRAASIMKDWPVTQDGLVVAFLATCTEAVSHFDDTNDPSAKERKQELADEAAARWPALAARAAAFPGAPLGATVGQVASRMVEMLEQSRAKDANDRIATRRRLGLGQAGAAEEAAA